MDRRTFLRRGVIGSTILLVAGGGYLALRRTPTHVQVQRKLHVLDEVTFGVFVAMVARIVDTSGADPVRVAHDVDSTMRFLAPEVQTDLRRLIGAIENGVVGLFLRGSPRTFTELSPEEQDDALQSWGESPIRLLAWAFEGLRRLSISAAYSDLEQAKAVGYRGLPFDKPDPGPLVADGPISPPFIIGQAFPGAAIPDDGSVPARDAGPAADAATALPADAGGER